MKLLTPRLIALLAVASILSLLLPVLPEQFISVVIFADVSVVSLLLPERLISIMARLVAAVCSLVFATSIWVNIFSESAMLERFPFLYRFLGSYCWLVVFLYGLPLFMALAVVAIEKRRLARRCETPRPLQPDDESDT